MAEHLGTAAVAYERVEAAGARRFEGMLGDPVAPDPGPC